MLFSPIAIVGRACTLPLALTPAALWDNVVAERSCLSSAPEGRWGLSRELALATTNDARDRAWSDVGGYVRDFDKAFDPRGFALDAEHVRALDPVFQWTLHTAREALRSAKIVDTSGAGLVLGNLSFPSASMARFAEEVWRDPASRPKTHAHNRFSSGLPAHLAARALGLSRGAFALDAACASSLYAIKLACDRLHDGRADVMVAGAVNAADDLFIHVGFSALSALSRSGRSRPFHAEADGLVPAEGAAFVVLKRLGDAVAARDEILGVIRGVGLSNDGRGRGLLAPAEEGQERAMRQAYALAEMSPSEITLLECHATGTPVGDGTEVRSTSRVFAGCRDVPIGSLKSNLGHLITAAGVAALLKVLGAMQAGVRPASLNAEQTIDALADSPLRLLRNAEPWTGPKRAGISAFGFGGNNAHLIVEAWEGGSPSTSAPSRARGPVAIVGLGARVAGGADAAAFARDLFDGAAHRAPRADVEVSLDGLKFPPKDMSQALPQQLAVLEAAREAAAGVTLPRERTAVLVGMGCDPEVARYGARWRAPQWGGEGASAAWCEAARAAFVPVLESAGVVGTMPNIVANRINSQLDLAGPSFSVSAEEASGTQALGLAVRSLQAGEIDAAVVGAVDLSHEAVHLAALRGLGLPVDGGDAAISLVLKRLDDARRDGDAVWAVLGEDDDAPAALTVGERAELDATRIFGRPHAAVGLLGVAVAATSVRYGLRPSFGGEATPWLGARVARVSVAPLEAPVAIVVLREAQPAQPFADASAPLSRSANAILRVPAHRPVPVLPVLQAPEVHVQTMMRAPALPSVFDDLAPRAPLAVVRAAAPARVPPRVAPTSSAIEVAPVLASAAALPPAAATGPFAAVLARMSAQRAELARIHTEFVTSQAAIHDQFLAMRARAEADLLAGYRAAMASPSTMPRFAPSTPVAPPAEKPANAPPPTAALPPVARAAVVVAPAIVTPPPPPLVASTRDAARPGPKFARAELEILASGQISRVFGPAFEPQDGYARQVRMPEPPLLLADRVTGIDAAPLSMGTGTIWTETDVREDSWYLDRQGRMPAGIMIESGQADLLLISWLGADMLNRGERVYRLLGCELTYHGGLPGPGDTLAYDIHVDGHAAQGDVRLFFFHYDCRVRGEPRLSVRGGQAGFFTDEELADSAGVLWDPTTDRPKEGPLDAPTARCTKRALTKDEVRAFAEGRPSDCFGPGWERTRTHVRTPGITSGRMLFLDEVTELDARGGPWGRGYLRAETAVSPDDWHFNGHFKNDPCMPGTLMFDGCLQAMALMISSLGFTIERDGWRFEPVPEEKYLLRCRGQVTPSSRRLTYEIFVSEVIAGPIPTVFADLLCTVDGRKAFHAKRVGLRLVPDFPLSHWRGLGPARQQESGAPLALRDQGGLVGHVDPEAVAVVDGFRFGYDSLIACAWGPPSEAFGPFYARFDGHRRVARLPGPPYHFMSRVTRIDGPIGGMQRGTKTEIAYDVPASVWYFEQSAFPTMPFCVLLEAALQPCGWLASYVGSATTSEIDLLFRNLDGTGTLHAEIMPGDTLRTRVEITSISASAGMIIESFTVECHVGDKLVYDMKTVFGFFPKEAFDDQVGLPIPDADRARIEAPWGPSIELDGQPARYCSGTLRLPEEMLLMLDRVTGVWPDGGQKGLGYYRAEKQVDVDEWFFKAHFFQDPVQPGSLGIEALTQLLQFAMLDRDMGAGLQNPRFEPLMLGRPLTWKYRGQVVPKNERITSEIEIVEIGEDERGRYAVCDGYLWVDGKRIYSAKNLGMRIVSGPLPAPRPSKSSADDVLDPARDTWLLDHCPTWTAPALPMMSMCDRMVAAVEASEGPVASLEDVQVHRWLPVTAPVALRAEVRPVDGRPSARAVTLSAWREASDKALSRFEPVASAVAVVGSPPPAPADLPPLASARVVADPYAAGRLFHGPAFRYLVALTEGPTGASGVLRAELGAVPRGHLHQGLLDAATHVIPHDALSDWSPEIGHDKIGYPYRISNLSFHAPLPDAGEVRVEARFAGFDGGPRFPAIDLHMIAGGRVCVSLRLVEILLPKGRLGNASPAARLAFVRDRSFVPDVALSTFDGAVTQLSDETVHESDWLAGTVASVYGLTLGRDGDRTAEVAVRDHVARRAFVHPSALDVAADLSSATARVRPLRCHPVAASRVGDAVRVVDAGAPVQRLDAVRAYWDRRFGIGPWPVEDLYYGLIERFVGDVVVSDPDAFARIHGRSCLYLGNHQVGVESLLFSILVSALSGTPTVTLAKAEHRASWLGELIAHNFSYPAVRDPNVITFFDREDKESLVRIVGELSAEMTSTGKSAMVHVEGTRSLACRRPVVKMSSVFLDMAIAVNAPIVPVRFVGGLPLDELHSRIEFPVGYGKQDIWLGRPILPAELAALPYKDRKQVVLAAMNGLGPTDEEPAPPDASFARSVDEWIAKTGASEPHAVLLETLSLMPTLGEGSRAIVEGARSGTLNVEASEKGAWLRELATRLYGPRGPRVLG